MSDDRKKYYSATQIGIRLPHSNATMLFISKHDPELYAVIRDLKIANKKRKRKK